MGYSCRSEKSLPSSPFLAPTQPLNSFDTEAIAIKLKTSSKAALISKDLALLNDDNSSSLSEEFLLLVTIEEF